MIKKTQKIILYKSQQQVIKKLVYENICTNSEVIQKCFLEFINNENNIIRFYEDSKVIRNTLIDVDMWYTTFTMTEVMINFFKENKKIKISTFLRYLLPKNI